MIKNSISRIALLVLVAIVMTSILSFTARAADGNNEDYNASMQANVSCEGIQERAEASEALTTSRHAFEPKFQISFTVPNFARPARRAPIRRKGRIQP
jgi:hypothetical protein